MRNAIVTVFLVLMVGCAQQSIDLNSGFPCDLTTPCSSGYDCVNSMCLLDNTQDNGDDSGTFSGDGSNAGGDDGSDGEIIIVGGDDGGSDDSGSEGGPEILPVPSIVTVAGPEEVDLCARASLVIDADAIAGGATNIRCSAPPQILDGAADFATDYGSWDDREQVSRRTWPNGFPCDSSGQFAKLQDHTDARLETVSPLNITGYENIDVSFLASFQYNVKHGDKMEVRACCGESCSPTTFGEIATVHDGGTNLCVPYSYALPNDTVNIDGGGCSALTLGFRYQDGADDAALDDIEVSAYIKFSPLSDDGLGRYSTEISSCVPASIPVTCEWFDDSNTVISNTLVVDFR